VKSEFHFLYSAKTIVFAEEYSTSWTMEARADNAGLTSKVLCLDVHVAIRPDTSNKQSPVDGELVITLPGKPEDVSGLVYRLAQDIAHHISFFCDPNFAQKSQGSKQR